MNKLHHFVVLLLALVAGFGTVRAQYVADQQVTEIPTDADVCLSSPQNSKYAQGKYLCGADWATTITSDCIYHFVATGRTVDEHPTYYLKQVSTGLYLGDNAFGSPAEGNSVYYTDDESKAYEFTALQSVASPDDARTRVDAIYEEGTFVLARATQTDPNSINYFCAYASPTFFSSYYDTNQWLVQTVREATAGDDLSQQIDQLLPNGLTYYKKGTTPGCVPEDVYTQLETAYNAAQTLTTSGATKEDCDAAYSALAAAVEEANGAILTVEVGKYYYFVDTRGDNRGMCANGSNLGWTAGFTMPDTPTDANIANYIWKVEDAGEGNYYLKNYATGTYIGANDGNVKLTASPEQAYTLVYNTNNGNKVAGVFNINAAGTSNGLNSAGGNVVVWYSYSADNGNCWSATPVDDSVLSALEAFVELSELLDDANTTYLSLRNYTSDATADGDFSAKGIVTDAAQLSTNAQCESEGPIGGLLDSDFTSYFHSEWQSSAPAENHYIQINLGEDLQTFVLKYAERVTQHAKSRPATVRVLYTNTPNDANSWADAGTVEFTYPYSLTQSDETTLDEAVGLTTVGLPAAAQYVRLVVLSTTSNQLINGYPFFYLSELRVYPATYDAANSAYEYVDQDVLEAFEAQLTAAEAVLAAGNVTQDDIDALQSAYDALMAQLPVPARLTQAIADARAAADKLPVGEGPGTFPQSAKEAFEAAVAEVEATVNDDMTFAAVNEGLTKVATALSTYQSSLAMPEAGKVYTLRGMTTDANNTRALNAVIYSNGNSTTEALQSMAQVEGVDPVTPTDNLNYLWKVEAVENGNIVLRNLGTGYYFGKADALDANVPNVKERTELPIRWTGVAGGFNLTVGDGLYANFAGQNTPIIAWNTAEGADNSAIRFDEVDMSAYANRSYWPVESGVYQVLCLPYAISSSFDAETQGTAYDVLGQFEDGANYTLELVQWAGSEIPAGMPFVFKAAEGVTQLEVVPSYVYDEGDFAMTYAEEAQTTASGALTGTLTEYEVPESENGVAVLVNGTVALINSETTEVADRTVNNNSGYFNAVMTSEKGEDSIELPGGGISTGIDETLVDADAPVDVYTLSGVLVRKNVNAAKATQGLPAGLYIVGGQKVLVK
mgnify:CR=1 FL=1